MGSGQIGWEDCLALTTQEEIQKRKNERKKKADRKDSAVVKKYADVEKPISCCAVAWSKSKTIDKGGKKKTGKEDDADRIGAALHN